MIKKYKNKRIKRHVRVRGKITGTASRPRLTVFRSSEHIYAQIIDDEKRKTLVSASDLALKDKITKTDKAKLVGKEVATLAKVAKVKKVTFDRGGFAYHGRVAALAAAAREAGLEF
jgi:large subunit ribosomal protein L18